nr:hypothetical protein [uncultured Carboxylicivirga sp.]
MGIKEFNIWNLVYKAYLAINTTFGVLICLMNYDFTQALKGDQDPNPASGLYILILGPMLIAFVLTLIISLFLLIKQRHLFKTSLIPLATWGLSFILLLI